MNTCTQLSVCIYVFTCFWMHTHEWNCWVYIKLFEQQSNCFPKCCTILHSTSDSRGFKFLHILQHFLLSAFFFFFYYSHLSRGEVESHCSLICISLMTKWLMPKQPFMPFLQFIFFGEMFIQIFSTLLTVSTFYYWAQIHFYKFLNTQQKKTG